jgi:hypothetical protein
MMERAALGAGLTVVYLLGVAAPAHAAPLTETIQGEHVRLVSTADPDTMRGMLPGDVALWDVSVSADAPEPGRIDIALSGTGELPLTLDVRACSAPWEDDRCAPGATVLRAGWLVPLDGARAALGSVSAAAAVHVRLEAALRATPAAGATSELRLHASGYGDELDVAPPGSGERVLPRTGMHLGGVALLGTGAVIAGVAGARLMAGRREETAR